MKRFVKEISEIVMHCTATPAGRDIGAKEIREYHLQRGFETIGYHYVVRFNGVVEHGRDESFIGAHCLGHNDRSIGVAYVGGLDAQGRAADTRTQAQQSALRQIVSDLLLRYPKATVHGHNEFAAKDCPCFDVRKEFGR